MQTSPAALMPDLIIINATVHTMDAQRPTAGALAIVGNRIEAVGTSAQMKALAGTRTRVFNARKQLVLPGFNDAHVHFLSGGFQLSSVDLRDAATPQEFAGRIGKFAAALPAGKWVTGGDWDHERWPTNSLPTRDLIDAAT
ncbi:MAG TPA: amidohydrolase family protein, partial [Verrucomicrobiae bacterium]|nr:amidohydrolase family protein [Verrucomicrobiae bacterium]